MRLDIEQDHRFQQREWRIERIGWVLLTVFVVAGLIGLLGTGPLSWATASSPGDLVRVDYQRFTHHEADDSVRLTFGPDAVQGGAVLVELTGSWVHGMDRQGITPQPAEERVVPGGMVLEIPVERPGTTELTLTFRAQEYGPLAADVVVGDERTSFTQFVLP